MPLTGQTFLHYRVLEKVGEGGMGAVYKALDTHLDRPVALKVLPPDKLADPDRRRRFVQEAKAASSLNHPNIVVVHDIASDGGVNFIVMEYVEGQTLDQLIGRRGLRLNDALGLAVQIADGLARAHAAGLVHRDLKPTNVMVTADGRVKILDFGLAKLTEEAGPPAPGAGPTLTIGQPDQHEKPRTEEGFIMGTAAYMSPEQAEGRPVDARSDIFSFGALLYEMLTGSKAFRGETRMSTLAAILREEPQPAAQLNESLPPDIDQILARCLRKDPQRRWQNMSDLKVVLLDLKEDSESGKLTAMRASALPLRRRGRLAWIMTGSFGLLAAAVLGWIFFHASSGPPEYEITRLTFESGICWFPAFSPDGKMFAYVSDRAGGDNQDVYVQQLAGGPPLRLTSDPAMDSAPSFTPDGARIIFHSERDGGGIYEVGTLGGGERRIADRGRHPRCSPDGAWISFIEIPASQDTRLVKMFLVPRQGGQPVPFQPEFNVLGISASSAPVWSPDGKYLIFNGRREGDPSSLDWWVAPVGGGPAVRTGAHHSLALSPNWQCPYAWTGSYLYFSTGTTVEGVNLFRVPIEKSSWRVKGPAQRITSGAGMQFLSSVLPDGRVLYAHITWVAALDAMDARPDEGILSGNLVPLTKDAMVKFFPSLSRDGGRLAFVAFGGINPPRREVRVLDLATGEEKVLPMHSPSLSQTCRISPDGRVLSYGDIVDGRARTFVFNDRDPNVREVCEGCDILDFFADPNFALVQENGQAFLRLNLTSGEKATLLQTNDGTISEPALSPDDRWLAFILTRPKGGAALCLAPVDASRPAAEESWVRLFDEDRYLGSPAWSPNGSLLYYLSERNGPCALWVQKLDAKSKRPAAATRLIFKPSQRGVQLNVPRGNAAVAVGRDKIVLWMGESSGNIYLAVPKRR